MLADTKFVCKLSKIVLTKGNYLNVEAQVLKSLQFDKEYTHVNLVETIADCIRPFLQTIKL